jgi:UDP-glucose 4-epimerase
MDEWECPLANSQEDYFSITKLMIEKIFCSINKKESFKKIVLR